MKKKSKTNDGSDGGCLSTNIANCRRAVAFCNDRAIRSPFDSERAQWFELAALNQHRANVLARGEA